MAEGQLPEASCIPLKHARVLKGPHQMAFDITNRCNFNCLHCYNRSNESLVINDELDDSEILGFIRDISSLKPFNFCFCGGEPMLRDRVLYKSAEILTFQGCIVSMVTNGSLITKEKAKALFQSGVNRIQLSLDGSKPETHNKLRGYKNAFQRCIQAITFLKEVGFNDIMVAFTPTAFNWDELEGTYNLCEKFRISTLRIQPLMLLGRAQLNVEEIVPSPIQYRKMVIMINKLNLNGKIKIEWGDPIDHLIRFRTVCEHCINYAHVKANGGIAVSPYLPLIVGNIKRHRFSEYWNAGLSRIWELSVVKKVAQQCKSITDMKQLNTWFDNDIELDIIDCNLT